MTGPSGIFHGCNPGPWRMATVRRFGRERTFVACACVDCQLARVMKTEARKQLRRHHRRPRPRATPKPRRVLSPAERADRALRRWAAQHPCSRCGGTGQHVVTGGNCGLTLTSGRPDRRAHGARCSAGRRLAKVARARATAEAASPPPSANDGTQ